MARKRAQQQITLEDIMKLGPKKIIVLIVAAIALYFLSGEGIFDQQDDSGFIVGTVTRVVDGDTAEITVNGDKRRVRFLGVDTPETVHPNKPVHKAESDGKKSLARVRPFTAGQIQQTLGLHLDGQAQEHH